MDDSSMIYKRSLSCDSEPVAINKDVQELTLFWENFLNTNNEKIRIEWLELFMFKYEVLIAEPEFNADNQQFLSSIPSHFICYLLKLVYSILSELNAITPGTRIKTINLNGNIASPIIKETDAHPLATVPYSTSISMATAFGQDELLNELFRDDKDDDASNECGDETKTNETKTIVALREFLAKGNGGRMLRVLESLDLKGLLCSRELASVLVSFFPRSVWSTDTPIKNIDDVIQNESIDLMKLQNAIDDFEFHTRFYFVRSEKSTSTDSLKEAPKKSNHLHGYYDTASLNSSTNDKHYAISKMIANDLKPDSYQTAEYNIYEQRTQSCDYIGSIILNILQKLITNESNESLVQTSATIKSLWFSIGQYHNIEQNRPFQLINHEKIKRKLITITFLCLNKIFPSGKKLEELFNVRKLLQRLMDAIAIDYSMAEHQLHLQHQQNNNVDDIAAIDANHLAIKLENLNALIYSLFLILQNMLINRNGEGNLFETLFNVINENLTTVTNCLCLLTKVDRQQKSSNGTHVGKILHILLKLIYILSNVEAQQVKSSQEKLKIKRKLSVLAPPMVSAHHKSYKLFKCMLESIVLHMAQEATPDKMRMIFTFFRKYTICCCNIHLGCIHRMLKNSLDNKMHKICLNFIKQNVLRTVFMDDISCLNCDSTNFIFEFKENFVTLYKTWFQYLNEPIEVIIFFKHIAKLSKYLHVDIQSHILVDIVLPVFRKEKQKNSDRIGDDSNVNEKQFRTKRDVLVNDGNDSDSSDSDIVEDDYDFTDKLIICCLNIFLCYLKDVTVIKAFFIDENIQHLADLFVKPKFAYLVSNLLKIGIDNSQFLGETMEERQILCQRLETMQIHLFSNCIDILVDLFNDMSSMYQFKLKQTKQFTDGGQAIEDNQPNYILAKLQSKQLSIFEVLHLSVIYWNLILQLIRSSHDEFRGKVEQCLTSYENLIFNLVYNSLSCVLFMVKEQSNAIEQQHPSQQQSKQQMKHLPSVEQQTIDLLNSSIISNLTLSDFEIVTTDELNIDYWSKCSEQQNNHEFYLNDDYRMDGSMADVKVYNQNEIYSNLMSCLNNERNGIFQLTTSIDAKMPPNDDILLAEHQTMDSDQSIKLLNNFGSEPSLIYNSRNNFTESKMLLSSIIKCLKSGNSAAPNYNHIHLMIDSVQKLTHFVSKKVFGTVFNNEQHLTDNASTVECNDDQQQQQQHQQQLNDINKHRKFDTFDEHQLIELNTNECKKLLMQLFEITLGVMLCEYKDRKADIEMSNALQELKQLLLSKTIGTSFSAEKTKSIVDALLSLLKVAEMRNKCCFFDDCAHPTLARQNMFSLNISLENDRLLLLTGQSNQNETTTNDFYGQSDGDTTETDNSYETADEGYDADGEAAKFAETDIESDWSQSTASTAPPFRTHYVHEGICKIVIEILIDLSKRCLSNSTFCLNSLMQIATRLFSIRDILGGPLYLIKGFSNVLESNEVRLRDFQKSILDLITDLNTPDTLCAYLNLMTSESPPLDILLSRLIYLGSQGQSVHPSIEIEFPIASDAEIKHNCDRFTFENIYKIYNGHDVQKIKSPFTQAAYIVPLNDLNFKPWTKDGFTFTSWLRLNSDQGSAAQASDLPHDQTYSTPDSPDTEKNLNLGICSQHCLCKNKQHFISIGTNVMMLSIYLCVTNVNTMYFQLSNPSTASHKGISKSHSEHFRCTDTANVMANGTKKTKCTYAPVKKRRSYKKDSQSNHNEQSVRLNRKPRSKENHRKKSHEESSSTSNVLTATRMALKSSLSHFNLFSSNRHHDKENDTNSIGYPVEIRGVKLHKNRWTLFSLAASFVDGEIQLEIFIDNAPAILVNLPCTNFPNDTKKDKLSLMCIGHKYSQPMTPQIKFKDFSPDLEAIADTESHSFRYSLSNVLLFRKRALKKEMLANLYALGPDCVNFAQCQIGNLIPNLGISVTNKIQTSMSINEVLRTFREHLLVVYSAHKPNSVIGYNNIDEGEPLELIRFGCEAMPKYIPSFHTALYLSGGLPSMLYLFARVVELSNSDVVQSAALQFLLKIAHSNSALYTEFIRQNYFSLIGAVIRSEKCLKTIRLLNAVLETACSSSIISKGPDGFELSINKNICIIYADLFVGIINHYSDWHDPNAEHCDIIEMLFSAIQSLVSEKHMHQALNISRLSKAKLVSALFNFCKIHLTSGSQQQIFWSKQAAESMVNIIRIFAGAPPAPALLDDIVKVLLMLHRPSNSFVTHDRSKFYFLLSSSSQSKSKRNGLPLAARKLSLSLKKSPKSSTDSILQRSTSLDQKMNKTPSDPMNRSSSVQKNSSEETIIEFNRNMRTTDRTKLKFNNIVKSKSSDGSSNGLNVEKRTNIILNPNDKAKLERALSQLNTRRNKRLRKVRIKNKGRQRTLTDCETERDLKSKRRRKRSVSDSGIDLALFREYDIIADEELKKISGLIDVSDKEDKYDQVLSSPAELSQGIVQIQNGLLELLRDFIMILPDTAIEEVLSHYVTLEIVLVLANNQNACVRSSIIRLLTVMCERYNSCSKNIYSFHLGNQISLYEAEFALVQSCVQWITGSLQNIDQLIQSNNLKVTQKYGLNPLIAIVPQTVHDISLAKSIFDFLCQLYNQADHEICSYMVENGMIPAVTKTLARVYVKWGTENDRLVEKIEELLCLIARKSISTAGCINILWDLLNSITYIEQSKGGATYRGIRSTQATILLNLLTAFFPKYNNPSMKNFKLNMSEINLNESVLSTAETRTRLELLSDRTVQFIRTANLSHTQTSEEIKLIKSIVNLSMCGFSRGGGIIPWSFLPSNPMPLKLFIIRLIARHANKGDSPLVSSDPKLVKAMIHSFWLNDRESIPKDDLDVLKNVCDTLGIQKDANNSYIPQAILKMDLTRENSLKEQKPSVERTVFKFDSLAINCIESAMKITRYVVEIQNSERRNAIAYIRVHDENCLKDEWNSIIDRMTHEGAPWYSPRTTMNSWELDPTEGPTRIRIRMKRCNLDIPQRFLLKESDNRRNDNYQAPLAYLKDTLNQRPSCTFYDHVLYTFPCKSLQVDYELDGELIITETNLIFIPSDDASSKQTININVNAISEVWLRRYQHLDNAIEFFLETNTSIFLIFQSTNDREMLKVYFADKILQCPEAKLNVITQQWREGQITNWEYLMALNLISGRTYQDLMQYPVFPWILSDYESATLDLNGIENYRILSKPIAIQHSSNENHYVNSYNYLNSLYSTTDAHQLAPYHYGSHYSNSGTVLHFLVRIAPFTRYFLHYQDNNFDLPDRTFHSIVTTWRLASRDSTTDVKELIPEFFSFPEFLENAERFNFGVRQSGEAVDNVELPPWARDSPRLFIFIHRQALESDIARRNLHKWIDLVFGWRQSGQPAVEAINVFHPATYYGFSSSKIADPVERSAMETMVRTYGQMPKMLFKSPHPAAQPLHSNAETVPVLKHIKGLHWGCYTGSIELSDPHVCCLYQQFDVNLSHLMALPNTNVIYAFSAGHNVMQGNEPDTMNLIQWKQSDSIVRIKPLRDGEFFDKKPLTYNHHIDEITTCGTDPNFNQLWFGHESGRITVYQCNNSMAQTKYNKQFHLSAPFNRLSHNSALRKISMKFSNFNGENDCESSNCNSEQLKWKDPIILIRHTNTVTAIHLSKEFKIAVSVANDGYAIIWDANNLNMVRSIQRPTICKSPISLVTVSSTLGDIVTVHDLFRDGLGYEDDRYSECCEATENIDDFVNVSVDMNGKSLLRLHTINGKYISHITIPEKILCICYSYIKEGTGVNVIATGLENGIVRLWSSIDLSMVREFMVSTYDVLSLTYSTHQHLVVLTSDNIIQVWDSQGLHGNPPKFPQVVFQKRNSV